LAKDCKNKTQQGNPKKERTPQANIIDVDHLGNEVLKMNLFFLFFLLSMSTKSTISSGDEFIFV
jgi:hypothetical protein